MLTEKKGKKKVKVYIWSEVIRSKHVIRSSLFVAHFLYRRVEFKNHYQDNQFLTDSYFCMVPIKLTYREHHLLYLIMRWIKPNSKQNKREDSEMMTRLQLMCAKAAQHQDSFLTCERHPGSFREPLGTEYIFTFSWIACFNFSDYTESLEIKWTRDSDTKKKIQDLRSMLALKKKRKYKRFDICLISYFVLCIACTPTITIGDTIEKQES